MSRDRHYRHARAVAVEQTIDEVQVARAATSGADRETTCDMRIRAGGERSDFLVPDMQPLNAAMAAQCIGEAIEAVAYDSAPMNGERLRVTVVQEISSFLTGRSNLRPKMQVFHTNKSTKPAPFVMA